MKKKDVGKYALRILLLAILVVSIELHMTIYLIIALLVGSFAYHFIKIIPKKKFFKGGGG